MNKIPFANRNFYEFFISPDLVDEALQNILKQELDIDDVPNSLNPNAIPSKAIHNKNQTPIYHKELFDELEKCVDEVSDIHFNKVKLSIHDAWMTRSNFAESSQSHHHSFSIFSGLLYMTDSSKTLTSFSISDPFYEKLYYLFGPVLKKQRYEYNSVPKKGRLIIWESDVTHQMKPNRDTHTRYTLAFNTWPTGTINDYPTQTLITNVEDVQSRFLK